MKKVAFHTLGCKVNHYDSEAMMDIFKSAGYKLVDFSEKADIYVINSCTVTNEAARKSRQMARKAARLNSESLVVLAGCYTQVSPEEVKSVDGVDLVIGTGGRSQIVKIVEDYFNSEDSSSCQPRLYQRDELNEFEELKLKSVSETTRAYVKIEEGCNQFCTYCIIPAARGPVRSRSLKSVLDEVKRLTLQGVKEIVLTGTHLGLYGTEKGKINYLNELINRLMEIKKLARIRLSSIEITEINEELIDIMASSDKLCSHLHIPLQSGSDSILQAMNRPYTTDDFRIKMNELRDKIPDIAVTTDVMVAFPGESKKLFDESYEFVKEMKFSRLHVFPFSIREGTEAALMDNQIPGDIKKEYSKKMRKLNKKLMMDYQEFFIGKKKDVIVEDNRDYETGLLTATTDNYLKVLIDVDEKYIGEIISVKLDRSYNYQSVIGKFC